MAESATRLYALLARNHSNGVVFRRGPSKLVQLLQWDLANDTLTPGQWFKGRVYERLCDLSPDGKYLLYFAANFKPPYGTWSAISKPPYFSALALWPKGDTWGGGGLFDADSNGITLNHSPSEMAMADGFKLPPNFRVRKQAEFSGWGTGELVLSHRLVRDGWIPHSEGVRKQNKFGSKLRIEYTEPQIWIKAALNGKAKIAMETHGMYERRGAMYVHELKYENEQEQIDFGRCDWADITKEGVVYFSTDGVLKKKRPGREVEIIADLTENSFEEVVPTEQALEW